MNSTTTRRLLIVPFASIRKEVLVFLQNELIHIFGFDVKVTRQEFYSLPKNENLFLERALKEAVHELGHTYRLGHCGDTRCTMHFSNSLQDTDIKGPDFCPRCKLKLR